MRLTSIVAACLIGVAARAAEAAPNPLEAPCANAIPGCSTDAAQRLQNAFMSDLTTDEQRAKMKAIIAERTASGAIDWKSAADDYFTWRAQQPVSDPPTLPDAILANIVGKPASANETSQDDAERERGFRRTAEAAVRARLVDPDSAKFEWPYAFTEGYWKPFLQKRVYGKITCGLVNARNRMGGYTGATSFIVVLDTLTEQPIYVEIGTEKEFDLTEAACEKAASSFLRPAPAGMDGADDQQPAPTSQPVSVADELEKLAALRDKGILTESEFEAQKAKLLGEH